MMHLNFFALYSDFPPMFWTFRMELLLLSLFIVFDHRYLGHKNQVNKITQQVIINDSYSHELWLCAILLYD